MGAGTMLGALLGFRWRPLHPMRTGSSGCLPWPAVTVGFAVGRRSRSWRPLFAVAGVGLALFGIWWETALAERVPPHTLSRVSSYDWMGSLALLPVGLPARRPARRGARRRASCSASAACSRPSVLAGGLAVRENWTLRRLEPA